MKTRALICHETQEFEILDVLLPPVRRGELLVRTLCSGVSIGTEFALIRNRISWGPYPLCTGYQAVGVVDEIGPDTPGFSVGDKVYYRGSKALELTDGTTVSMVSGTHAAHAVATAEGAHGTALLPDGVRDDVGCLFVMPSVGLLGIDLSNPRVTDTVVVYGAGAIGLGVVAGLALRGCTVVAIDIDDSRLAIAKSLGADHTINASTADVEDAVQELAPSGADVVFEASGNRELVGRAIALCRFRGKFIWQGNYGEEPLPFDFLSPHGRQLTMFFPCDDGYQPFRQAVMRNMACGALRWEETISCCVASDEAPQLFDDINTGARTDIIGSVIRWSE